LKITTGLSTNIKTRKEAKGGKGKEKRSGRRKMHRRQAKEKQERGKDRGERGRTYLLQLFLDLFHFRFGERQLRQSARPTVHPLSQPHHQLAYVSSGIGGK
jgi:hypothetical protein